MVDRLREYFNLLQDKGRNVQFLIDDIDQIEAYIQALESQPAKQYKHLAAKLLSIDLDHLVTDFDKLKRLPLPYFVRMRAEQRTDYSLQTIDVRDTIVDARAKQLENALLNLVDDLAR
jgi:hypothetical protein